MGADHGKRADPSDHATGLHHVAALLVARRCCLREFPVALRTAFLLGQQPGLSQFGEEADALCPVQLFQASLSLAMGRWLANFS